ncbi:MAG: alpha/beta hydrolase [Flavobacteriaceae bacterium]|nr:alpha/beta hydrolase [Flavobacteriaceae bacterium]
MEKKPSNNQVPIPRALILFAKILYRISPKWATHFAIYLFSSPIRHPRPAREDQMNKNSRQSLLLIPQVGKKIQIYQLGDFQKKVLIVHGWSGRGTQLFKIADAMVAMGYTTISFDAPGHGKSPKSRTHMKEYIQCIEHLEKTFGPFDFAIGHSLGGMAVLNSAARFMKVKKIVCIGVADIVSDIVDSFVKRLELSLDISTRIQKVFETKLGEPMNNYSASFAASRIDTPVLFAHDKDDLDVPFAVTKNLMRNCKNGTLFVTEGLGHNRILGDARVLEEITTFLKKESHEKI